MRRLEAAVFLAGAALMGLEIVGSRVLAPTFGTSIFVWGALITTFLAALAAGYAVGGRVADRWPDPRLLGRILAGSGCLLWLLFIEPRPLLAACAAAPLPDRFRALAAALVLFAPPSVLMGAVTPFAVRLAAREIASIGSAAGRLSAISTAGSILGTFAMTFFLIPSFPTRPILFGLGLALVAAAALVPRGLTRRGLLVGGVVAAAAAAIYLVNPDAAIATPVPNGTVIFEKETAYHHLRVVDSGRRRWLYFDNRAQGSVSRGDWRGLAGYPDGMAVAWALRRDRPKTAVSIGLGAGMVPTLLTRRAPEVAVVSIEIDPEVVRTAGRFFGFAPDANDRVVVGDGRRELARGVTSTDGIFLDAFYADSVPFHLLTKEFDELCYEKLTRDGVYAANFAGALSGAENALFWAAVKTLREVFPQVYILSGELASGSRTFSGAAVLLATKSPDRLDPGTLRERAREVAAWLDKPGIAQWAEGLYEGELRVSGLPVLTDAYSPTDALQHFGAATKDVTP